MTIWRRGATALCALGGEVSAAARAALTMPLGLVLPAERFDPTAAHPTPVVLVHGLFGDPTNFLALRAALEARGARNFASFSYRPRLDYPRLASWLAERIDAVCRATGMAEVDVVGHSLGGLVARHLLETSGDRVRRLVTLGAPYFARAHPPGELAVFAAYDPLVPVPPAERRRRGRTVVVPGCGHLGLLRHPMALGAVTAFLTRPALPAERRARAAA
jgi:pimeloyl-ACP methyl ester carboxylesterase